MKIIFPTIFLILTLSFNSFAQHWTGAQDADWNNSANWSEWPLEDEKISIDPAMYSGNKVSPILSSTSVFSPERLTILNGAQVLMRSDLHVSDDMTVSGNQTKLSVSGFGTLTVGFNNKGRLTVEDGSSVVIDNASLDVVQRLIIGQDAVFNLVAGIVNVYQRLIVENGGRFKHSGGNVFVNELLAIGDGSANSNSEYDFMKGNLTINGELSFENEAGDYNPTLLQTGGLLTVDGDVTWFGESPGSGQPHYIQRGGAGYIEGNIFNLPGSTVQLYMSIEGGSLFSFIGDFISLTQSQDTFQMLDSSQAYFRDMSFLNNGVLYAAESNSIFRGNCVFDGSGIFQLANMKIEYGTVTQTTAKDLNINGDFYHIGTYVHNSNKVVFNGSKAQHLTTLQPATPLNFYNLSIKNESQSGVTFEFPTNVQNTLELIDGKLNTSALSIINLEKNATSNEGSDSSFVNGPMSKTELTTFLFPVGKNETWARINLHAANDESQPVIVEYFDSGVELQSELISPLQRISEREYWSILTSPEKEISDVTLFWENANQSDIFDCNDLTIAYTDELIAPWQSVNISTTGDCTGNSMGTISNTGQLQQARFFTFGFKNISHTQFKEICQGDSYVIGDNIYTIAGTYIDTLMTDQNEDSIVITVLSLIDVNTDILVEANVISAVEINGTNYNWLNCNTGVVVNTGTIPQYPVQEAGDYALLITINGCTDTSACVNVKTLSKKDFEDGVDFTIYPNPINGLINISGISIANVSSLQLTDINGHSGYLNYNNQNNIITSTINTALPGVYILSIELKDGRRINKKLIYY